MNEQQNPHPENAATGSTPRRWRASDLALGVLGGVFVALAALAVVVVVSRRQAAPVLTVEALAAARQRWEAHGPGDYRLDLVVTGRRASSYHVEVHDGKPTRVLCNQRPTTPRTWYYWTVPGLFEVVEHDIECADDPTEGFGASPGSRVVLRAVFDAESGYPRRYERLILGEPHLDMTWQITRFETGGAPRPEHSAPPAQPPPDNVRDQE